MIGETYVVGIGHKARQGKDTLARFLQRRLIIHEIDARVMGIADDLKAYCRVRYGLDHKDNKLLIDVGAAQRRTNGETFWRDRLLWRINYDQPEVAIIPDVRFPFEVAVCDITVRVIRLGEDGTQWISDDRDPLDETETALSAYDGWTYEVRAMSGELKRLDALAYNLVLPILGAVRCAPA